MDLLSTYAADLQEKIRKGIASAENPEKPLTGRHIIVDAGNGAGGFFVERVLQPLGANTSGSQFLDPDGTFPNHVPNPDNKAAMKSIQDAVIANKADLGIIFDTDVDRSAIVDSDGKAFNRNNLIAFLAHVHWNARIGQLDSNDALPGRPALETDIPDIARPTRCRWRFGPLRARCGH